MHFEYDNFLLNIEEAETLFSLEFQEENFPSRTRKSFFRNFAKNSHFQKFPPIKTKKMKLKLL